MTAPAEGTTTTAAQGSHRFIVVEGPIGVGKTSLACRIGASLSADLVLEQAMQNPFLERFYRNPRAGAFPAQLYFLFQRAQQLAALKQQDLFSPGHRGGLPARQRRAVRARHAR